MKLKKSKKIKLLLSILLITNIGLNAQINLVGAATNPSTGMIDMVKWQALDPASVVTVPSILQGYYMGSSAFDAFNGNYYLPSGAYLVNVLSGGMNGTKKIQVL